MPCATSRVLAQLIDEYVIGQSQGVGGVPDDDEFARHRTLRSVGASRLLLGLCRESRLGRRQHGQVARIVAQQVEVRIGLRHRAGRCP